jgi:hypothetical protein
MTTMRLERRYWKPYPGTKTKENKYQIEQEEGRPSFHGIFVLKRP